MPLFGILDGNFAIFDAFYVQIILWNNILKKPAFGVYKLDPRPMVYEIVLVVARVNWNCLSISRDNKTGLQPVFSRP